MTADDNARAFLDTARSMVRARITARYVALAGSRMLEIRSGFGTNIAVWQKTLDVDAYGVEPGNEGFEGGFEAPTMLPEANGLDPERIVRAFGASLPFIDESFDLVYSANVLEHTSDPIAGVRFLAQGAATRCFGPQRARYFVVS
jgi:hypothetical protein